MWVTCDVFTWDRMIKLKPQKGVNLIVTIRDKFGNWALGKYTLACNLDNYSLLIKVIKMSVPMQEPSTWPVQSYTVR